MSSGRVRDRAVTSDNNGQAKKCSIWKATPPVDPRKCSHSRVQGCIKRDAGTRCPQSHANETMGFVLHADARTKKLTHQHSLKNVPQKSALRVLFVSLVIQQIVVFSKLSLTWPKDIRAGFLISLRLPQIRWVTISARNQRYLLHFRGRLMSWPRSLVAEFLYFSEQRDCQECTEIILDDSCSSQRGEFLKCDSSKELLNDL